MSDLSMTPDLRELLGAIADDPRAQLLRVKTAQAAREGLERNPKVSSSAPFLRKAERRLLELHREELGRLLYAYAHIVRMQVPENALRVHYQDCKVAPPTKTEVDHRAQALLATKRAGLPVEELLRHCLKSPTGLKPSEIIGAVLRVTPSGKAQVAVGSDLLYERWPSQAYEVFQSLLKRSMTSWLDSFAWEGLGHLAVDNGALGDAVVCYESSVSSDPGRVVPALAWLRFSLLAESKDSAASAAAFIDHRIPGDAPALAWYRGLGESGSGIVSSSRQKEFAQKVASQCGPVSRSVLDGFQ